MIEIIANSQMERIMLSANSNVNQSADNEKIIETINAFFNNVSVYEYKGKKCISARNCFTTDSYIDEDLFIVNSEWDANEIYIDESAINDQFKNVVQLAVDTIILNLRNSLSSFSFIITVSVQTGQHSNITIKIYQNLGINFVSNLEEYDQPVMQIFVSPLPSNKW